MKIRQDTENLIGIAKSYFAKQQKMKELNNKLEAEKKKFYSECDKYFSKHNTQEFMFKNDTIADEFLKISKAYRTKVIFDVAKMETVLDKELFNSIVNKHVEINDVDGFMAYMKSCKVNPKILKSFLNVTKNINEVDLENMEAIGKISMGDLKGCYKVETGTPYYTIRKAKGESD